ncbi:MAG: ATP-binding cassette domain-containing protein, partial [Bacilli bacterium]|nr:ATP-binding cassette domain-containing protein [Bacilli bacterium]
MIKINNVDKFYNKNKSNQIQSLKDINIELPDKGIIAIFGPSGCGKTTLLNVIGGLDNVNKGNIFIDGQNIKYNTDIVRNKYIGYIFQNYNLNNNYTNFENVSASLKLCGVNDE